LGLSSGHGVQLPVSSIKRGYIMKKVLTIIVDDAIATEIFEDYHDLADFISMETEAEYYMKDDGWKTWDDNDEDIDDLFDRVNEERTEF
jgi:hypothetical protein